MRHTDFCTAYMRAYEWTRALFKDSIRIELIFNTVVLIEGSFNEGSSKMPIKSPQIVFQVSCFCGLPVFQILLKSVNRNSPDTLEFSGYTRVFRIHSSLPRNSSLRTTLKFAEYT